MLPHQERVVTEKAELDSKIEKLNDFVHNNKVFETLHLDEQGRLWNQLRHMKDYSDVLGKRIAAFK